MRFVEDDDVVQALAADRADDAFDVGVLPWGTECDRYFVDAKLCHALAEHVAVDAVVVADEKPGRFVEAGSEVYWYFTDHLGSVRDVATYNTLGAEAELMAFDEFNDLIGVEQKYALAERYGVK
jgi:hypothetical protein